MQETGQVRYHTRASQLAEELPRVGWGSRDLVDAIDNGGLG